MQHLLKQIVDEIAGVKEEPKPGVELLAFGEGTHHELNVGLDGPPFSVIYS